MPPSVKPLTHNADKAACIARNCGRDKAKSWWFCSNADGTRCWVCGGESGTAHRNARSGDGWRQWDGRKLRPANAPTASAAANGSAHKRKRVSIAEPPAIAAAGTLTVSAVASDGFSLHMEAPQWAKAWYLQILSRRGDCLSFSAEVLRASSSMALQFGNAAKLGGRRVGAYESLIGILHAAGDETDVHIRAWRFEGDLALPASTPLTSQPAYPELMACSVTACSHCVQSGVRRCSREASTRSSASSGRMKMTTRTRRIRRCAAQKRA